MDFEKLRASIDRVWDESILDRLEAYIRIPNQSPHFDPQWERNGHMEAAVQLMAEWCRAQAVPGMRVEIRRLPRQDSAAAGRCAGRDCRAACSCTATWTSSRNSTGWSAGLAPWEPVMRDGQAVWPGRGRRRLCRIQFVDRNRGAEATEGAAGPLRAADRGIGGERQHRSAGTFAVAGRCHRRSLRWWFAWMRNAAITTGCGARPRCAGI